MKQYQDRAWLEQKYWGEGLPTRQIAELCKAGTNTIRYWMEKHNIIFRTLSKAVKITRNRPEIKEKYKKTCGCPDWKKRKSKAQKIAQNRPGMKRKQSERTKKLWATSEYREKTSAAIKVAQSRPETKRKTSESSKRAFQRPEVKKRHREATKLALSCPEVKKRQIEGLKRAYSQPERRERCREIGKQNWQNPEIVRKMLEANNRRPTNPEKVFDEMTPDIIRYTGNRAWWRKLNDGHHHNPDFKVTGQNKVIEVFGDYWHKGEDPQELIDLYAQAGIDCLVFWEHEIYKNPEQVIEKTDDFIGEIT